MITKNQILFLLIICSSLFAFGRDALQSWNAVSFEKQLTHNTTVYVDEQLKWSRDLSEFYLHRTDLGLEFELSHMATISTNYKQVNFKRSNRWLKSKVPYSSVTFSFYPKGAEFQNRQLIELWLPDGESHYWRYRNRIKLYPQIGKISKLLEPYLAEELFFYLNGKGFAGSRSYCGISFRVSNRSEIGFYYCLYRRKDDDMAWGKNHIMGSTVTFVF